MGLSGPLIDQWFAAQAAERRTEIALRCGEESLTYGELDGRSSQLAQYLQRLGVGPETQVALYLERSSATVTAILGVLKAGGAYVPIDLAYPPERIRFMIEDAGPRVVLTQETLAIHLPRTSATVVCLDAEAEAIRGEATQGPPPRATGENAAYVIYTSDSTGRPKGVVVTHSNVVRLFRSTQPWFQFSRDDVWTLFHSFAFDFSVWELWGALFHGGKLVLVPHRVSRSPEAFRDLLVREKVTVLNQTPSAFRQLMWADRAAPRGDELNLRWVIFGGEALEVQSLKPWLERHSDQRPRLVNMYGITETTVHVTYRPLTVRDVEAGRGSVIGEPIPDLSLHILDEALQPCPVGVPGEIFVGGAGVAREYLGRPELTSEKFIPDPFSQQPGSRLYRSGDLARRLADGDVEYLGRADQQVKIRGFRIELGEIEAALSTHPGVRECTVVAQAEPTGDKRLTAYLIAEADPPGIEALQAFLKTKLPDYMVPGVFVFLDRLPLTPHGKVDRQALPAPGRRRPENATPFAPPVSLEEKTLAAIWESVLQLERVGLHDNFFALGGDSIRSIQVLARAREMGLRLSLEALFAQPTIAELARPGAMGHEDRTDAAAPFVQVMAEDRARLPADLEDAYPMARLQVGMLYHSSVDPAAAIFHDVFSFRFKLAFDPARLTRAIDRLASRHPIYRTSFDLGQYSEPLQLLHRKVTIPFTVEDLRGCALSDQEAALLAWIEMEKRRPFDWTRAPLLRLHAQRYSEESFQFIVSFHHAIMDGWSLAAMLTELFQEYTALLDGRSVEIATPPVAYRDFIFLEREAMASDLVQQFWKTKTDQAVIHSLPRWPAALRKGGLEQVRGPEIQISPDVLQRLQQLAHSVGVPLRTVLLAAHCRVLSFVTGQSDMTTGLVSNGRPQVNGGERLIGLFLNTLPFRIPLRGGTWRELVREIFLAERELMPCRRLPLSEIQRLAGGQPLFETVFDFVQFHVYRDLPGYGDRSFLEDHYFEANNFVFYLTLMPDASGSRLQMHCDYDPNELCEPQIRALSDYYLHTLSAMAEAPESRYDTVSPLPGAERDRLLVEWTRTQSPFPEDGCVHALIEAQAAATPDAVAAVYGGRSMTYGELDRTANRLAGYLQTLGVGPDVLVGIHLPRSLEMLIALLAVLKAGGAYVPLDPSYPKERLEFMMKDAQLKFILAQGASELTAAGSGCQCVPVDTVLSEPSPSKAIEPRGSQVRPEHLAYVIYTSGSTGNPKGVQIAHRALVNFLVSMQRQPGLSAADRLLGVTTLSFDISALELLLPLTVGARVVIASSQAALDPAALAASMQSEAITVLQATPTTWRLLIDSGWAGSRKLKALCGGEAMSRELADKLLERCGEVWNLFGPTETSVWSCIHKVEPGSEPVPIGRPIANTQVYLLDSGQQLVPIGSEGEIYIGGDALARGYLNQPELTAERFVNSPFQTGTGARLYRTGDLGRYLPNGTIVCSGRMDQQVKVRGFRIELGEIESVLGTHPALRAAVVSARDDADSGRRLVAYYSPRPSVSTSVGELRAFLEKKLPAYMVPSFWVELAEFPLTANGKVDRRQLPQPGNARPELQTPFVAPRTPLEQRLAALWEQILKVDKVGIRDNFFELGGHSLLAMQVIAHLGSEFQVEMSPAALFDHPSIESFALDFMAALLEKAGLPLSPSADALGRLAVPMPGHPTEK